MSLRTERHHLYFDLPTRSENARVVARQASAIEDPATGLWRFPFSERSFDRAESGMPRIIAAVRDAPAEAEHMRHLQSPDPRIRLTVDGDRLFVRAPQLPSASHVMRRPGSPTGTGDCAYVARVDGVDTARTIRDALKQVVQRYDAALVPPTATRPGIDQPPPVVAAVLKLDDDALKQVLRADETTFRKVSTYLGQIAQARNRDGARTTRPHPSDALVTAMQRRLTSAHDHVLDERHAQTRSRDLGISR